MERKRQRNRGRAALGERERRGVAQLAVSLLLFLLVFAGQEAFPEQTAHWREEFSQILRQDTDFRQILRFLGASAAEQAPALDTLETVLVEVLSGEAVPMTQPDRTAAAAVRLELTEDLTGPRRPEVVGAAADVARDPVQAAVEQGLGLSGSVTPVLGVLTSGFGVREHPIDGETKMHEGVDLAADEGTDILAFADGSVDYIGESPAYGLYLQLRHANGVTSFYAHCSRLCVQKGQKVAMGEVVAKVGDTGNTTGPHLHFEMKQNGAFLDPSAYIRTLNG